WSTKDATSISIDGGIGTVQSSGTKAVTPTATQTYVLTATGAGGTSTANVTVTVSAPVVAPTIQFSSNPASITAGQSSTLTWSTTNATSVTIDNGVGTVATAGNQNVSP